MAPFMASDFDVVSGWGARWPVDVQWFTKYCADVEQLFGLADTPYEVPELLGRACEYNAAFLPRLAKWPPFSYRNVAVLLSKELEHADGPEIWLGATAIRFSLDPGGRLSSVVARNVSGSTLSIEANETVIAAGAIESTRLLLLLDRLYDSRLFEPYGVIGRYFYDHLSSPTAHVKVSDTRAFNRIVGFRFENKTMRNLRFEPSASLRKAHGLPNAFIHISFAEETPSGFEALRAILRRQQERKLPSVHDLMLLASSAPWIARAVWWRTVEKRLLFPPECSFQLHTVIEQEPLARNRIALSPDRIDAFGIPFATIDWQIGESDARHAVTMTRQFIRFWEDSTLGPLAQIEIDPESTVMERFEKGEGIYHPGGSTRMGKAPSDAVVDMNFQTFAIPNLSVLSTSIFPVGGGSNPTMMLLMAAFRLADRLAANKCP
jgi:choline dehydrogenase-like flavoprotein